MVVKYKLNFKSFHPKYLFIGVANFLNTLKKKENTLINNIGVTLLKKTQNEVTVLKSPVVFNSARNQFKFEEYSVVLVLSFKLVEGNLFLDSYLKKAMLGKLNSQYIGLDIVTEYSL